MTESLPVNIVRQVQKTEITEQKVEGQLFSGGHSAPSRDFRTGDDLEPGRSIDVAELEYGEAEERKSDRARLQLRHVNYGNLRLLWPR